MTQIILIEDDDELRESMQEYLELSGFTVSAVGTGLEFFHLILQQSFDVAIVDLGLPDFNGQQLIAYLRQHSDAVIVVLTARNTLNTRVASYELGADLFMSKPVDIRELVAAINSLVARQSAPKQPTAADSIASPSVWQIQYSQRTLTAPNGTLIHFSGKEFALIQQLLTDQQQPVHREQLCQALYNRDDASAQAALLTLVKRVRQRMEQAGIQQPPIQTDHGQGYRFSDPFTLV